MPCKLAAHQEIEHLVGAAKLHVGFDSYRVVGLEQGVKQFGDGDGSVLAKALGKVVPFEELGDGEPPGQADNIGQGEFAEPLALVNDLGAVAVNDLEELAEVGLGVFHDLVVGEHGPGSGAAAGGRQSGRSSLRQSV